VCSSWNTPSAWRRVQPSRWRQHQQLQREGARGTSDIHTTVPCPPRCRRTAPRGSTAPREQRCCPQHAAVAHSHQQRSVMVGGRHTHTHTTSALHTAHSGPRPPRRTAACTRSACTRQRRARPRGPTAPLHSVSDGMRPTAVQWAPRSSVGVRDDPRPRHVPTNSGASAAANALKSRRASTAEPPR
jgi:hypothetical protein